MGKFRFSQYPSGWYGFTLGPPIFGDEQAGDRQGVVADQLGVEPEPALPGELAVVAGRAASSSGVATEDCR